ncbi:hypothetical protein K439DRAFT_856120 [Ramaria rubella]|nr:hypothetical protein K439DRAFT_856120 [Ramaria rubella]
MNSEMDQNMLYSLFPSFQENTKGWSEGKLDLLPSAYDSWNSTATLASPPHPTPTIIGSYNLSSANLNNFKCVTPLLPYPLNHDAIRAKAFDSDVYDPNELTGRRQRADEPFDYSFNSNQLQVLRGHSGVSSQESLSSLPDVSTIPSHFLKLIHLPDMNTMLTLCMLSEKRAFKCSLEGCPEPPFKSKTKAERHVYKHLGAKRVECSCGKKYSTPETAKRHVDTQLKSFSCEYCSKLFARKDYRNIHQKKCAAI